MHISMNCANFFYLGGSSMESGVWFIHNILRLNCVCVWVCMELPDAVGMKPLFIAGLFRKNCIDVTSMQLFGGTTRGKSLGYVTSSGLDQPSLVLKADKFFPYCVWVWHCIHFDEEKIHAYKTGMNVPSVCILKIHAETLKIVFSYNTHPRVGYTPW